MPAPLHLTKVAFACSSMAVLADRLTGRAVDGSVTIGTRYRPKRADEMVGGSLFWIIKHMLVARSPILGFEEGESGRCLIRIDPDLVPVRGQPRRAHQGWRYLDHKDAPDDLGATAGGIEALPHMLAAELSALALI